MGKWLGAGGKALVEIRDTQRELKGENHRLQRQVLDLTQEVRTLKEQVGKLAQAVSGLKGENKTMKRFVESTVEAEMLKAAHFLRGEPALPTLASPRKRTRTPKKVAKPLTLENEPGSTD